MPHAGPGPTTPGTVPELLAWRRCVHPDRIALEVHGVGSLTFAQWQDSATAVAAALRDRGLRPGDRVALLFEARGWLDFAVAYCAVQRAGGVAVPLSARLAPTQVRHVLDHCAARAVIHDSSAAQTSPAQTSTAHVGVATVAELVGAGAGADPQRLGAGPRPGEPAQILYTSGTTGRPKGVCASHANLTAGAPTHPRRLALAHSERFLHAFGIGTNAAQTMLLNALRARPAALTLPQFTPARFTRLLESSRAGTVFLVPAMAVELLNSGALDGRDTAGVHLVGSTAAPLPPAIASRLATAFPNAAIVNSYTSTEAAPAQTTMIFDPARPDAVGRAVAGTLMIADGDGRPLPAGAIGEVWLRAPQARRYVDDDAANGATFRGDWVRMGDLGRLVDGYLYLVDRDSDVIKSGAYKVSTLEIEAALYEHPLVAEAAAVGTPHPVLGAAVAVAVVPRAGAGPGDVGLPALRRFLADRLADYQLPARVLVLDALPRNEAGKVRKRELITCFETTSREAS